MPVKKTENQKIWMCIYIYNTHTETYTYTFKENGTASKGKINACKFKLAVKSQRNHRNSRQ